LAGYSNRHLGQNLCEGVANRGARQPCTIYLERAEANFTEAITVATAANNANLVTTATAGEPPGGGCAMTSPAPPPMPRR
jgi:hypothetical protein